MSRLDNIQERLKTVRRTSFGFAEDLETQLERLTLQIDRSVKGGEKEFKRGQSYQSAREQFSDVKSVVRMYKDEPGRVKTEGLNDLFGSASSLTFEGAFKDRIAEITNKNSKDTMNMDTDDIKEQAMSMKGVAVAAAVVGAILYFR